MRTSRSGCRGICREDIVGGNPLDGRWGCWGAKSANGQSGVVIYTGDGERSGPTRRLPLARSWRSSGRWNLVTGKFSMSFYPARVPFFCHIHDGSPPEPANVTHYSLALAESYFSISALIAVLTIKKKKGPICDLGCDVVFSVAPVLGKRRCNLKPACVALRKPTAHPGTM